MVEVSNKHKSITVGVSSNNGNTIVTAKSDTAQYWSNQAHSFADQAKESVQEAKNYAELANSYIEGFEDVVTSNTNNIITTSNDCINQIAENTGAAVDSINSTKTTILNDIEFVADGEKQEIENLADLIKENAEEIASRTSFALFDTVLKDHILTYEESKGLALQGTWVYKTAIAGERFGYPDFYTKCLEEYNEATSTGTVNGVTVKVHSNGHKFYDIANKTAIDDFFNTMGLAWFYGVDTENERVFLPRSNYFEQATGDVSEVGKSVEAGLPNISGFAGSGTISKKSSTSTATVLEANMGGSFYCTEAHNSTNVGTATGWFMNGGYAFDASRSSKVYGKSNTVQPNAVKKLLYICVGNTVSDTSWVDIVTQVEGGVKDIDDKINEGIHALSNASNALRQTQITNCLLEVPQRIKLELNNGTLTLKAGSEVIVPNGFEADGVTPKFDYVDVESDVSGLGWVTSTGMFLLHRENLSLSFSDVSQITSGTSSTISGGNIWYDTTSNTVKRCDDGSTWRSGYSLPFCLAKSSGSNLSGVSTISSLDQIFNGMGYIGSTVWVDKGVKGLIPNGRNEDGTLNNIEYETSTIGTQTLDGETTGSFTLNVWSNGIVAGTNAKYDSTLNKIIGSSKGTSCFEAGQFYAANGKITSFAPKQPVNLATRDMVDGRWVGTSYGIVSNTGFAANKSATYDLSNYLPNDGYNYEVLFSLQAQTGATSGYEVNLSLGTDIAPGFIITKGVTRASARISCVGTATVPVGRARQVTIKQWSTYPCDIISFDAVGYRRIGTNL